jgi:hypothetical protein
MSRTSILFVLFFCVIVAFAAPLQQSNATLAELDKRITHVGRVRFTLFNATWCLLTRLLCPGNVVPPQRW